MINVIWFIMLVAGILIATAEGDVTAVTTAAITGAEDAVKIAFGLIGILAFWSGMMKIAEEAGVMEFLSRLLRPVARLLFPSVPANHPAIGSIIMAMSANLLGLGNAATPLGIKAMKHLQQLNPRPEEASDAMCTLLAITTSSITIIPTTVIALRAAAGSSEPTSIIGPTIAATAVSTVTAVILDRVMRLRKE